MSSFSEKFIRSFRAALPSPLSIAIGLTIITFILALIFTTGQSNGIGNHILELAEYWENGLWGLDQKDGAWVRSWQLPFLVQMMLMLVLGYILALSAPVKLFIGYLTQFCTNTARAAFIVTILTLIISLINWGLGLIFGAIFARKVAEFAEERQFNLNYGLIGAAGYSGLMVWHGGLSGSAPIKASEPGNLLSLLPDTPGIPDRISMNETVFSTMNIVVSITLLIVLPMAMYWMGKRVKSQPIILKKEKRNTLETQELIGAEKLDHYRLFSTMIGSLIVLYTLYLFFIKPDVISLKTITPDFINLSLLGWAFLLHQSIFKFLNALDNAIGSSSGILIQFPFYFGILGIMKYSGLMGLMSDFFVDISTSTTFSINTFFSAGIVNIFVPSGGGQWAVQGPIILQAAQDLNLSIPESIMAIAYGDQLTNMLQPFWALPLLGITGLKPKDILPYTLFLMGLGTIIFILGLLIF